MNNRQIKRSTWVASALLLFVAFGARAAEPWEVLPPTPNLPAHTVGQHATVNGAKIWYAEWGAGRPGTPVLLLHGGYGNSNYFGNLIPVLVQHGYHVIAMDSRGHGRSARTNEPITYHLMASDVMALLDALKVPKVSLVGWSDGGCIGYDLAINNPSRLARLFAFGADADVSGLKDGFDKSPVFAAYLARVPGIQTPIANADRMGFIQREHQQDVGDAASVHGGPVGEHLRAHDDCGWPVRRGHQARTQ